VAKVQGGLFARRVQGNSTQGVMQMLDLDATPQEGREVRGIYNDLAWCIQSVSKSRNANSLR
jgi:hypothetical protein